MNVIGALNERRARLIGRKIKAKEVKRLRTELAHLAPEWFVEMLRDYPLVGSYMTLPEADDQSGEGVSMEWMEPDQIIGEALEMLPGVAAAKMGYLPVGILEGMSDPYFIQTRDGDDPRLVRISHEAVEDGNLIESGIAIVCDKLSVFLTKAK